MANQIIPFTTTEKTAHNSHKFAFTLSPTNYGHWKLLIQPFLTTHSLFGYVDGSIPCPPSTISSPGTSGKDDTAVPPTAPYQPPQSPQNSPTPPPPDISQHPNPPPSSPEISQHPNPPPSPPETSQHPNPPPSQSQNQPQNQHQTPPTQQQNYPQNQPPSDETQPNPILPTRQRPAHLRPNPKQTNPYNPSSFHTAVTPSTTEPTNFTNANKDPHWRQAMTDEYSALIRNGTWSLVPPVPNTNVVDCKWVYKLKRDQHGAIKRYKARLVAKGFNQQPGIDYTETFSPVVKSTTIRVVLSLAVAKHWHLRQLDVQNAFLHGDLKETVYLKQPPDPRYPNHVCLLHKSLYGLKQAPRAWFERLSSALAALGFTGSKTDPSLFIYSGHGTLLYMLVYVDDIILTGNNNQAISYVVKRLSQSFAIQDMGSLSYFLGIEVVRQGSDIILSQQKYIRELLDRAQLSHSKPVPSPCTTSASLFLGDSSPFDNPEKYRQMVGALQYVTLSRPDITFAVNKVCQFMHSPTDNHWSAVKRILRYLHGTANHGPGSPPLHP
ncbi:hypothetical protein E3N88_32445 [Mikania micrantha]|uniref:Reverse transcriptase Ty1/copia-type domain-containing protein n=1 Tax=Mikania micrantha TaxID=192012 RepID=A0A5N6M8E9_9ASTR|nr:hypothetical protein E3N88_32445 [Mikania micrantha]